MPVKQKLVTTLARVFFFFFRGNTCSLLLSTFGTIFARTYTQLSDFNFEILNRGRPINDLIFFFEIDKRNKNRYQTKYHAKRMREDEARMNHLIPMNDVQ